MRKVWRCPDCKQMSTRFGNLKRHISRKHNGIDKPILQYIIGNSIVTPDEAATTLQVFRDEHSDNHHPKFSSVNKNRSRVQNEDDWLDKWTDKYIEPVLKLNEYKVRMNAINQSLYPNKPSNFSQIPAQPYNIFSNNPAYVSVEEGPVGLEITSRNYDGLSGLKIEICTHCLTILTMPIGPTESRIQDIHRCDSMWVEVVMKLEPGQYAIDLLRKYQSLPELLFQQCKDWASNTTGQLYLTANKTRLLNDSDDKNHEIPEYYYSLPFIKTVLSESKIKLTDVELLEFLRLARNQTRTTLAIKSNNGKTWLEYNLALTNT